VGRKPPIQIAEPDIAVPRFEVDSSCLSHVGYDPEMETLYLTYRPSGFTYVYFDFTEADYEAFTSASSLGKYVNQVIKPHYHCLPE
jgi:hypothetical protein